MNINSEREIFIGDYLDTDNSEKQEITVQQTNLDFYNNNYFKPKPKEKVYYCFFCKIAHDGDITRCFQDLYRRAVKQKSNICVSCLPKREAQLNEWKSSGKKDVDTMIGRLEFRLQAEKRYVKEHYIRESELKTNDEIKNNELLSENINVREQNSELNKEVEQNKIKLTSITKRLLVYEVPKAPDGTILRKEPKISEEVIRERIRLTIQVSKKFDLFSGENEEETSRRQIFYEIIGSEVTFKLIVSGKGLGKTTNPMLFQILYIMMWEEGHFIWIWRGAQDALEKGRFQWTQSICDIMPTKEIPGYNVDDWKQSGGSVATANGVMYNSKYRVYFATMANYTSINSKLQGDAIHFVFDEAAPYDGKVFEGEPPEPDRWSQTYDNIMRKGTWPTECYFLSNPLEHARGMWWMTSFMPNKLIDHVFDSPNPTQYANSWKEPWVNDPIVIEFQEKVKKEKGLKSDVGFLLFRAPELRGKYGENLNLVPNKLRRKDGKFSASDNKWLIDRPDNYKITMLFKNCVQGEYVTKTGKKKQTNYFFYFNQDGEELTPNLLSSNFCHLCCSSKEELNSPYLKKAWWPETKAQFLDEILILKELLQENRLHFCDPNKYEAKRIILQSIEKLDYKQ